MVTRYSPTLVLLPVAVESQEKCRLWLLGVHTLILLPTLWKVKRNNTFSVGSCWLIRSDANTENREKKRKRKQK